MKNLIKLIIVSAITLGISITAFASEGKTILIGDSRTVGMEYAVGIDKEHWSAQVSAGYNHMVDTSFPLVNALIEDDSIDSVVIMYGVNDTYNVDKYIKEINEKAEEWKKLGIDTYYLSVNPVDDNRTIVKNKDIREFNTKMKDSLSENVYYIDSNTESGIKFMEDCRDGLHYSNKVYKRIFQFIMKSIDDIQSNIE